MDRLTRACAPFFLFLFLATLSDGASAQETPAQTGSPVATAAVPGDVREAMLRGDYDGALARLDGLLQTRPAEADFWTYLRAVALEHAGRGAAAAAAFEVVANEYPESRWVRKARFRGAEVLRGLGRHREAEAIFEQEARRLRSAQRQGELAAIYIEIADDLSSPRPAGDPGSGEPDHARACALYSQVLHLDAPPDALAHARYRMAQSWFAQGDFRSALGADQAFLAEFDPTDWTPAVRAERGFAYGAPEATRQRIFDSRLRLGRSYGALGQAREARRTFEDAASDLTAILAGGDRAERIWGPEVSALAAEERERLTGLAGDARYALAGTYASSSEGMLSVAALERFLESHPRHPKASRAAFEIGERFESMGRDEDALAAFAAFGDRPRLESDDADLREEDASLRRTALFRRGQLLAAQARYEQAVAVYQEYTTRFPDGPEWAAAQRGIVDAEYSHGATQREDGKFIPARATWTGFLERHPLDPRARGILYEIGATFVDQARAARTAGDKPGAERLVREAVAHWTRLVEKYPQTEEASHALYEIGFQRETALGELDEAIDSYRRCNFGSHAMNASARLSAMTQPELAVFTDRTWRSDEAARVRVKTRNVESIELSVYALDLEAYFRKHLTHEGVALLDLDLITADITETVQVDDYRRYAPIEREVSLPVEGPGVWAITVTGGERSATTLVVRTDIELIVKSSRHEVLVFAQNTRLDEPAPGVRVLLALPDPAREPGAVLRVEELATGADGVARMGFEELAEASGVRVLAVKDGHFASDGVALDGLGRSEGLTPRGFVYTDRPAYRPGQSVEWRAILRSVRGGAFSFDPGSRWRVEVIDPLGRVIDRSDHELSEFGTLHSRLTLDAFVPVGEYTIRVQGAEETVHQGSFVVEEYELQKIELAFDLERDVYYRGEDVRVGVRAAWYYGEPVPNAPLRLDLPGGQQVELRTDREGRAEVSFSTRDFTQEGPIAIRALLTEENVSASTQVYLGTSGYRATLEATREVVLVGQPFDAVLTTRDPADKAVARELRLSLLRRERASNGRFSEQLVSDQVLVTDDGSGRVSATFSIDKGGMYLLRAEGSDRFGNPIVASDTIFVSGEDDEVRLRVLAERLTLDLGEQASVQVHDRSAGGLALVTFEGERILDYRILRLDAGANSIDFDVDAQHAPNFVLAVAAMRGTDFYTASAEFRVARQLAIEVTPAREVVAPGETMQVRLRVTDALGQPVTAELSTAVVDAALLELYPDRLTPLETFFESATRRFAGLRTASSCTFSYAGESERIAQALLDEDSRREAEQLWDVRKSKARGVLDELEAANDPASSDAFFLGLGESDKPSRAMPAPGAAGVAGGRFGAKKDERQRRNMAAADDASQGAAPAPAETAFWSATIVTDSNGEATIKFPMPQASTRWRVTARGVTANTLAGQAVADFVSRAELAVELRAPGVLTEGDRPSIIARVHNQTGLAGSAQLKLRLTGGGETRTLPAEVQLGTDAVVEHVFELNDAIGDVSELSIELVADAALGTGNSARKVEARAQRSIPVRPWGLERMDSRSGVITSSTTFELRLPGAGPTSRRVLEIALGPDVERLLLDEALLDSPGFHGIVPQVDTASELIGVLAVMDLSARRPQGANTDHRELVARATALLARLVAAQNSDGDWAWSGGRGVSPRPSAPSTARAMHALGVARRAGLAVPALTIEKGLAAMERLFREAGQREDESKAMLVHALAMHGRGDFGAANRLHRMRNQLSPAASAYTTLALVEMGHAPMAAELAALLEGFAVPTRNGQGEARCSFSVESNDAWNRSSVEMTALALLALERALPTSDRIAHGIAWLLANRPWAPTRAHGLALAAVATERGEVRARSERMRVTLTAADSEPQVVDLSAGASGRTLRFDLPDGAGPVRVDLRLEGDGRPNFQAVLRGFSRDLTWQENVPLRFYRQLLSTPAPRWQGRSIPTGFGVLGGSYQSWINEVEHLVLGGMAEGNVGFTQNAPSDTPTGALDYLMVEIPLPAGTRPLEGSVRGSFESFEIRNGAIVAYVGPLRGSGSIAYTLVGITPGTARVLPPRIWSTTDPKRMALGEPTRLVVLPRGLPSPDEYRPTPDESFHLGKAMFDAGESAGARARLEDLVNAFQDKLHVQILREVASMLLYLAIDRSDAAQVVRWFEVLKEKDPQLLIPFDRVVAVGEAYRELEEFERALLVFRATIEQTFGKDLKVAGVLEQQGELERSFDTLARLCDEYPDLPSVIEARLTLSDQLLLTAPRAHDDPGLRRAGLDRAALTLRSILLLQRFLTLHPKNPLAPEAGLNLVSAHLALEDHANAAQVAGMLADVFREPRHADAFLYTRAVAEWTLAHDDVALELLQGIAAAEYSDDLGAKTRSENRDLALYILGQIHHARREAAAAASYYERVQSLFPDAMEALAALRAKSIELDEVTTARPGERVALELRWRNVDSAELRVYPVDLMTLYLRERNLAGVTRVNLAGISPTLRRTVELGPGGSLREQSREVEFELDKPGAYLVLARGDENFASGLVLVSELELEVAADTVSGRMRIQAVHSGDGHYVRDVDVRVIGTANEGFLSGHTDPRGLFVVDGVRGRPTVIARLEGGHYAFHRGEADLAGADEKRGGPNGRLDAQLDGDDYLRNVLIKNKASQDMRQQRYQQELSRDRAGVQVYQAAQ